MIPKKWINSWVYWIISNNQDTIHVDAAKFQKMTAIHFLQLDGACIEGDFSKWSSNIRWLQWRATTLTKMPPRLRCLFLTHLDLSYSKKLIHLWSYDDIEVFKNLPLVL